MSCLFPQVGIKFSIEGESLGVPTPPQIVGQFVESTNTGRHYGKDRHAAKDFHRVWFLSFLLYSVYLAARTSSMLEYHVPLAEEWLCRSPGAAPRIVVEPPSPGHCFHYRFVLYLLRTMKHQGREAELLCQVVGKLGLLRLESQRERKNRLTLARALRYTGVEL